MNNDSSIVEKEIKEVLELLEKNLNIFEFN